MDDDGAKVVSLSKLPLSGSDSSGGLKSISHDRGLDEDRARLGASRSLAFEILRLASEDDPRRTSLWRCRSGSDWLVMASRAAIEGGVDEVSWGTCTL